jgi:hypothetical protein
MSKLDKLKAHIGRWGWWRTLYFVVMWMAARYLGIEVFVARVRATAEASPENPCRLAGVTFREAKVDELLDIVASPEVLLDENFISAAIGRGDIPFGAFKDGAMIAYLWRSTSTAPHNRDCWIKVAPPYSYSYNSYAKPEFRGHRVVPGALLFSDDEMMKKGYSHRVGIIATSNFASLAMGKHLGSNIIGRVGYIKWFGRIRFFRSRSVADIGLELLPKPGATEL